MIVLEGECWGRSDGAIEIGFANQSERVGVHRFRLEVFWNMNSAGAEIAFHSPTIVDADGDEIVDLTAICDKKLAERIVAALLADPELRAERWVRERLISGEWLERARREERADARERASIDRAESERDE